MKKFLLGLSMLVLSANSSAQQYYDKVKSILDANWNVERSVSSNDVNRELSKWDSSTVDIASKVLQIKTRPLALGSSVMSREGVEYMVVDKCYAFKDTIVLTSIGLNWTNLQVSYEAPDTDAFDNATTLARILKDERTDEIKSKKLYDKLSTHRKFEKRYLDDVTEQFDHEFAHFLLTNGHITRPSETEFKNYLLNILDFSDTSKVSGMMEMYSKKLGTYDYLVGKYGSLKQFVASYDSSIHHKYSEEEYKMLSDSLHLSYNLGDIQVLTGKVRIEELLSDSSFAKKVILSNPDSIGGIFIRTGERGKCYIFQEKPFYMIERKGMFIGFMNDLIYSPGLRSMYNMKCDLVDMIQMFYEKSTFDNFRSEIEARGINDLASVRLESEDWKKTDRDFKYFSEFKSGTNPVFERFIEKYRIGLGLQSSGLTEKEIRDSLEFAESFEYNGILYSWPKSNPHFAVSH